VLNALMLGLDMWIGYDINIVVDITGGYGCLRKDCDKILAFLGQYSDLSQRNC
jgi:hypothetical protein